RCVWIRFRFSSNRQSKRWEDWTDSRHSSRTSAFSSTPTSVKRLCCHRRSRVHNHSLSDLLLFENHEVPGVPVEDVQDVSNYVAALYHGLKRMRDGFPLSLRLIREIHQILLSHGRGSNKEPGEFRRTQNWIGGTRPGNAVFVPPPPELVLECMGHLELFIHTETQNLPLL